MGKLLQLFLMVFSLVLISYGQQDTSYSYTIYTDTSYGGKSLHVSGSGTGCHKIRINGANDNQMTSFRYHSGSCIAFRKTDTCGGHTLYGTTVDNHNIGSYNDDIRGYQGCGTFKREMRCNSGSFVREIRQGTKYLRLICYNPSTNTETLVDSHTQMGSITTTHRCPNALSSLNYAIISPSRVYRPSGSPTCTTSPNGNLCGADIYIENHTSELKEVTRVTCNMANPLSSKTATDSWKTIISNCDNSNGVNVRNCNVTTTIGIGVKNNLSAEEQRIYDYYKNIFPISSQDSVIKGKFRFTGPSTNYNWINATTSTWNLKVNSGQSIDVPAGFNANLRQVNGALYYVDVLADQFQNVYTLNPTYKRVLTGTTGSFSTPFYPQSYYPQMRWEYVIKPSGILSYEKIELTFRDFSLASGSYLEISDGEQKNDAVIGKFIGTTPPTKLNHTNSALHLYFHTVTALSKGFDLSYRVYTETPYNLILTSLNGMVQSPHYPSNYKTNLDWTWIIKPDELSLKDDQLILTFGDFSLQGNDFLEVRDGSDSNSPLIGKFQGTTVPYTILSSGGELFLYFHSDNSGVSKGFSATYTTDIKTVQSFLLTDIATEFTSPHYPSNYRNNLRYEWIIRPQGINFNDHIRLYINSTLASGDYIEIKEDCDTTVQIFNPGDNPGYYISNGTQLIVYFYTDNINVATGFRAAYELRNLLIVNKILTKNHDEITSPNYPGTYLENLQWTWILSPHHIFDYERIELEIEDLGIEGNDFLDVRDGNSGSSNLIKKLKGFATQTEKLYSTGKEMYLNFVTDNVGRAQGFRANYKKVAKKIYALQLTEESGLVSTPYFPNVYSNDLEWSWSIHPSKLSPDHQIILSFSHFKLEGNDYLEIFDGNSISSPLIQKFDKTNKPHVIYSSGQQLFLHFVSDNSGSDMGFNAIYSTEIKLQNKVQYDTKSGLITLPNNTNSEYGNNMDWKFIINPEIEDFQQLKLEFTDINIEDDKLTIKEFKDSKNTQIREVFSGENQNIQPILSNADNFQLEFSSNFNKTSNSFLINYETITRVEFNQIFKNREGSFSSPEYPNNYINGLNWDWIIGPDMNEEEEIEMKFIAFETKDQNDYLEVRDGSDSDSALIGVFYGDKNPGIIKSNSSSLYLKFITDNQNTAGGFEINYKTVVRTYNFKIMDQSQGVIKTPSYPNNYVNGMDWYWLIKPELLPHQQIKIEFTDFNTEIANDILKIYDGISEFEELIGEFHGSVLVPNIYSTNNELFLHMHSDSETTNKGFEATYSIVTRENYTQVFNNNFGQISSPDFPNTYNKANWVYIIKPNLLEDEVVSLVFSEIDISPGDYIEIGEGGSKDQLEILNSLNSKQLFLSKEGFYINFIGNKGGNGFFATFQLEPSLSNSTSLTEINGIVSSPFYPNNYANLQNYDWKIQPEILEYEYIKLNISDSDLRENDTLTVRNGPNKCSNILDSERSTGIYKSSNGEQLFVSFISDKSNVGRGFYSEYEIKPSLDYKQVFDKKNGILFSPYYPENYVNNLNWKWTLKPTLLDFEQIVVKFENFNTDPQDHLTIYDGEDSSSNVLAIFNGQNATDVKSGQFALFLQFETDFENVQSGFFASYDSVPRSPYSQIFEEESITFLTPYYPDNYVNNIIFDWTITPKHMKDFEQIILIFNEFDTEENDYLMVYDGEENIGNFSGLEIPDTILSENYKLKLIFNSDDSQTSSGFNASYTIDCRKNFDYKMELEHGIINSPYFPKKYKSNLEFKWQIKPKNMKDFEQVIITFEEFELNDGDFVEIYDGDSAEATLIGKFTGNLISKEFRSKEKSLFVKFITDDSNETSGFKARYTIGPYLNYAQTFSNRTGRINSPYNPSLYTDNLNWTFLISPEMEHFEQIKLSFNDFRLESCGDSLSISDSRWEENRIIGNYQGFIDKIPPIYSNEYELFLRFKSNEHYVYQGFEANYEVVIRKEYHQIKTRSSDEIVSPNFPNKYPSLISWTWTISPKEIKLYEQIELTFEEFSLFNENDFIEIRIEGPDGPLLGTFEGGSEIPPVLETKGTSRKMFIKFQTENLNEIHLESMEINGFKAAYKIVTRPFFCVAEGIFPDTESCNKFHYCVSDGFGGFIHHNNTCFPNSLVYCAKTERCDYNEVCPCYIDQPVFPTSQFTTISTTTSTKAPDVTTTEGKESDESKEITHPERDETTLREDESDEITTTTENITTAPTTSPTTTTENITTVPTTTTTTTKKPGEFVCELDGSFKDPNNCSKYFVCIYANGKFITHHMNCPGSTVFCSDTGDCGYEADCPC